MSNLAQNDWIDEKSDQGDYIDVSLRTNYTRSENKPGATVSMYDAGPFDCGTFW